MNAEPLTSAIHCLRGHCRSYVCPRLYSGFFLASATCGCCRCLFVDDPDAHSLNLNSGPSAGLLLRHHGDGRPRILPLFQPKSLEPWRCWSPLSGSELPVLLPALVSGLSSSGSLRLLLASLLRHQEHRDLFRFSYNFLFLGLSSRVLVVCCCLPHCAVIWSSQPARGFLQLCFVLLSSPARLRLLLLISLPDTRTSRPVGDFLQLCFLRPSSPAHLRLPSLFSSLLSGTTSKLPGGLLQLS